MAARIFEELKKRWSSTFGKQYDTGKLFACHLRKVEKLEGGEITQFSLPEKRVVVCEHKQGQFYSITEKQNFEIGSALLDLQVGDCYINSYEQLPNKFREMYPTLSYYELVDCELGLNDYERGDQAIIKFRAKDLYLCKVRTIHDTTGIVGEECRNVGEMNYVVCKIDRDNSYVNALDREQHYIQYADDCNYLEPTEVVVQKIRLSKVFGNATLTEKEVLMCCSKGRDWFPQTKLSTQFSQLK